MRYKSINRIKYKPSDIIILLINTLAFILGAVYLIFGSSSIYWNIYGIYMLIVLTCNIVHAYFDCKYDLKGYAYLGLSTLLMIFIPILNMLFSFLPSHHSSRGMIPCAAVLSLFVFSGFMAAQNMFKKKTDVELLLLQIADKYESEAKNRKIIRIVSIIILSFFLIIGFFISYGILVINKLWKTEVFLSAFALFYAFLFLSAGTLIIKLLNRNKKLYIKLAYLSITLFIFICCLVPIFSVPALIGEADTSYSRAFGEDYKTFPNYQSFYFRRTAFSIPEYFFGTASKDYTVRRDIPFYSGTEGIDKGLRLYFDVYNSSKDGDMLPGGNSVLIRIHGGEWKYGDKGFQNSAQTNKYFASQGYVVFDIQYGLGANNRMPPNALNYIHGDFSVDDMVRHIGVFMDYLAQNHKEFNANIDSVFISGSSAGGNLALASGISHTSGKYPDIASSKVKIKGIIPFYPANGLAQSMGLISSEEFSNPGLNADYLSPPCLIFQGTHDGLVNTEVTKQLLTDYVNGGNKKCSIIHIPYGGHSSDIYFSGYYNQVFLYYMERFMYQYR